MDISNATAAGPSRGLLDMIFGSEQAPGEADADGQGFGNLMNLIKALNAKKEAEGQGVDIGRTQGETMLGKSIADSGVVGMPGMNVATPNFMGDQLVDANAMLEQDQRERMQRLAELGVPAGALMMQGPVPAIQPIQPGTLQPEQINQALKAKGLPQLSPQEMKLLQEVNGKLAQATGQPGGTVAIPPELAAAGVPAIDPSVFDPKGQALPKAAASNGQAIDPALQKAMAAKGLDAKKLKAAEMTNSAPGTPETAKILPTETYLQMHESANAGGVNAKTSAKELAGKGPQGAGADSSALAKPEAALTAGAVAGVIEKAGGSRKGDDGAALPEGTKQAKLDALASGGFGGALAQTTEAMKHDVYLPGADKPEQRASVLMAEVGSGVAFQAHKGGGEMRLVIHPDDMGEVKLKIGTKNGKVDVQIMAENEEVAKMIRAGSKDLEASLKNQSLSLSKFEVTVGDASSISSADTKGGLTEQFLPQNQQHSSGGFSQGANGDDSRGSRWGADQGNHQGGGGYSAKAEDTGRIAAKAAAFVPQTSARSMMGQRRLDVVA